MITPCGTRLTPSSVRSLTYASTQVSITGSVRHAVRGADPDLRAAGFVVVGEPPTRAGVGGVPDVERGPLPLPRAVVVATAESAEQVSHRGAVLGRGDVRHRVLVVEADLPDMEGGGQVEDRLAVLPGETRRVEKEPPSRIRSTS